VDALLLSFGLDIVRVGVTAAGQPSQAPEAINNKD
jgi:hypothetical protein